MLVKEAALAFTVVLAGVLPAVPSTWAASCTIEGTTGRLNPARGSVLLVSGDYATPGNAVLRFRIGGYEIGNIKDGPMLAIKVDSAPTIYSDLGVPTGYGEFSLGLTNLAPGTHSVSVGLVSPTSGSNASYARICFNIK